MTGTLLRLGEIFREPRYFRAAAEALLARGKLPGQVRLSQLLPIPQVNMFLFSPSEVYWRAEDVEAWARKHGC